jgi:hypothetical protein
MTELKSNTVASPCECGCGQSAAPGKRFIRFHANRLRRGPKNPNWVGGAWESFNGRMMVLSPNHPGADAKGYVLRSHLVAEQAIGRYLRADEVVHHVNRDRSDDSPANLRVMTHGAHTALHHLDADRRVPSGEECSFAKLTEADVAEIRSLQSAGLVHRSASINYRNELLTVSALARRFGVDRHTIRRVLDERTWVKRRTT